MVISVSTSSAMSRLIGLRGRCGSAPGAIRSKSHWRLTGHNISVALTALGRIASTQRSRDDMRKPETEIKLWLIDPDPTVYWDDATFFGLATHSQGRLGVAMAGPLKTRDAMKLRNQPVQGSRQTQISSGQPLTKELRVRKDQTEATRALRSLYAGSSWGCASSTRAGLSTGI